MPRYDDGLDDDGYPVEHHPYVQGSEEIVGEFKPVALGGVFASVVERAKVAMEANRTADSPIESILGAAIIVYFQDHGRPLTLAAEPVENASGLLLVPQFKWAIYRSDWAIYNPKTSGALLIECDGKEFHSSVNQISHDMRKDQAAHDRGYLTMRFTGSQIHKGADACAAEIFGFVHGGKNGSHS
jgi:very-short-patch-repair endonuclease